MLKKFLCSLVLATIINIPVFAMDVTIHYGLKSQGGKEVFLKNINPTDTLKNIKTILEEKEVDTRKGIEQKIFVCEPGEGAQAVWLRDNDDLFHCTNKVSCVDRAAFLAGKCKIPSPILAQ